jgi:hypothetical protein
LISACVSLRAPAEAWLGRPAAAALAQRLWGGPVQQLEMGMPRYDEGGAARFVRPDDVAVELVRVPQDGARRAFVLLPRREAARMVDFTLGGDGRLEHVLGLRESELGVLGYLAARVCAELGLAFEVCDVGPAHIARFPSEPTWVVWPLVLHTPLGALDLRIVLSEAEARALPHRFELGVLLHDRVDADVARTLAPGDLLVSDSWALTVTTRGLQGPVTVQVSGCAHDLTAHLSDGMLHVTGAPVSPREAPCVEVRLARLGLPLHALAAALGGCPWPLSEVPSESVLLSLDGEPWAEGALVVYRGAVGVRVARTHSMR